MIFAKKYSFIFGLYLFGQVSAEVITYPGPKELEPSNQYTVEVAQNNKVFNSFVYITNAETKFNLSKTTSFTCFSFSGKIIVKVTKLNGNFRNCKILPSSYNITATKEGNSVTFELDKPRKLSLEFDDSITHPVLLFADCIETNIPSAKDSNVMYFGPGFYDLEKEIRPKPNQIVYIAGGAYIKSKISIIDAPNVKIMGRGILEGSKFNHKSKFIVLNGSDNVIVEGIILLNSPGFNVSGRSNKTIVRNIKTIGWGFNTDGIDAGDNLLVEDCFLKCNDDAIKLYHSGEIVRRCVLWQMENGAPFQISWNMPSDNSGFLVEDCDVIRCDHAWDNPNEGIFSSIHGGSGTMSNYVFDNIRIENSPWRLVSMYIMPNQFADSKICGNIRDILFKNITVTTLGNAPLKRLSILAGLNEKSTISNVTFENLKINGKYIRNAEEGRFEFDSRTTSNIKFVVTEKKSSTDQNDIKLHPRLNDKFSLPIKDGINSYGMRDYFLLEENSMFYLTGTEVTNPEWPQKGIVLYASNNLQNWREEAVLINRMSLTENTWYHDVLSCPKIYNYKGKYYLVFCARNQSLNPYGPLAVAIAVSDKLKGPYNVITKEKPLVSANTFSIIDDGKNGLSALWEMNGAVYTSKIDLEKALLLGSPVQLNSPGNGFNSQYIDAPWVTKHKDSFYLFYAMMKKNWQINYARAKTIFGPYKNYDAAPIVAQNEFKAETNLAMPYGKLFPFSPPTEQIGHMQVFKRADGKYFLVYHSQDKYAEPYLCIVPMEFTSKGDVELLAPAYTGVNWPYGKNTNN